MSSSHPPANLPKVTFTNGPDYRDTYANNVQIRVSTWDFHLTFGTQRHDSPEAVTIENSQGVYLSPQQAKTVWHALGQSLAQYQQTFGNIALEPQPPQVPAGPVN